MFVMTADISIGRYRAIRPAVVTWRCSVGDFADECRVVLPLSSYVKTTEGSTEGGTLMRREGVRVMSVTECMFGRGDAVTVRVGYDGRNNRVFMGFVRRVDMGATLTLECEGYSWLLNDVTFTRSYQRTSVRQILADMTAGTPIRLSDKIDDVILDNVTFDRARGIQVLEWLQKECACRVYFNFDELYAGASQYAIDTGEMDLRLGWNTVSEEELKRDVSEDVQINIVEKDSAGSVKRVRDESRKYSATKEIRVRSGMDTGYLRRALKELQEDEDARGYEGGVTLFLEPYALKGMVCNVTDGRFPERSGKYFVEEVKGSFDSSGGRQTIKLKNYGKIQ